MKKTLIIALTVMAICFTGCTQENDETKSSALPENNDVTLTISAVTKNPEMNGEARTRISYGSTDATWETGDKIYLVKSDGTTITLTLSDGAGTTEGSFTSTDPVVAGTYTPYAVSATSLTKGYVSIAGGEITLNLSAGGGGTLADALEHDILKGDAVELTDNQATATISGLSNHILSYLRFKFTAAKAISTVGLSSTGGINQTVTIATDGTITGSNPTTDVISVTAGDNGSNVYSGYFAIYDQTSTSLLAHAVDAEGGKYSRLVKASDSPINYVSGTVYGKSFTLSDAMMTAAATGQLSSQTWKNLGLSVKWAESNIDASSIYDYNYNDYDVAIPSGWRKPTKAEVSELFYASNRTWITGSKNAVQFDSNGNSICIGAGGIYYWWFNNAYSEGDRVNNEGTSVQFWVSDAIYDACNIHTEGTILEFGNYPYSYNSRNDSEKGYRAALRLVCDY